MAQGMYIGVTRDIPIYSNQTQTLSITSSNITSVFGVSQGGEYFFRGNGSTFTTNNGGVNSSTAKTELMALYDMTVSFSYSYGTEANYDKYTIKIGSETILNAVSGSSSGSVSNRSLAKGQKISFEYTKDGSSQANGDSCSFSNMSVTYTTQTQTGSETKTVASKVKRMYIGVDGKARKVKKAYIGINNVAKLVWFSSGGSNPDIDYYSTLTYDNPVYANRGASIGTTYAVFTGGGTTNGSNEVGCPTTVAYNSSLTKSNPTALSKGVLAAGMAGNSGRVIIAGGYSESGQSTTATRYNTSLTKSTLTALSRARCNLSATVAADTCIIFAGGDNNGSPKTYYNTVDVYVNGDSKNTLTTLSVANSRMAAEHVGGNAIFTGGAANSGTNIVDYYNSSLSKSTLPALSETKYSHAATYTKDRTYALFAGGAGTVNSATVDAFNASLTRVSADPLSVARFFLAATHIGGYAVFGGGISSGVRYTLVESYDNSLTRSLCADLTVARNNFAAASAGNYGLFVGGYATNIGYTNTIDVYKYNK